MEPTTRHNRRLTTWAMLIAGLAIIANVAATVLVGESGRPLRVSAGDHLLDLAAERPSVIDRYGLVLRLRQSGVTQLALDQPLVPAETLDGLADITLEIRPVSIDPELLANAAEYPGFRGVLEADGTLLPYVIVAVGDPVRAGTVVDGRLVIAPEGG